MYVYIFLTHPKVSWYKTLNFVFPTKYGFPKKIEVKPLAEYDFAFPSKNTHMDPHGAIFAKLPWAKRKLSNFKSFASGKPTLAMAASFSHRSCLPPRN